MSIQRSIQTGLMVGQIIQTSALRNQVAQMQQLALAQQAQADHLAIWRRLIFNARKLLDEAERELTTDPHGALYSISVAYLNVNQVNDAIFSDFHAKEIVYQTKNRAAELYAQAQPHLSTDAAQGLYRLAWLNEVKISLTNFIIWLKIREKIQGSAFFFTPSPGVLRNVLLFFGGNIVGGMVAGILFQIAQPLGIIVYMACNGITLMIADAVIRGQIVKACHQLAEQTGGYVGGGVKIKTVQQITDQARTQLANWGYQSTANDSVAAEKEMAAVDDEIGQLSQTYLLSNSH